MPGAERKQAFVDSSDSRVVIIEFVAGRGATEQVFRWALISTLLQLEKGPSLM